MAFHFTRVNKGIPYLYIGENKRVNGVSRRVNEKSIGRLDEIERYILKRMENHSMVEVKEYGLSSVLLSIADKLNIRTGFHDLIKTRKNKKNLTNALMLIILYNICHKGGKLSLKSWFEKTNLSRIIDIDLKELEVYNLCRCMDLLEPFLDAIEKLICFNILALDDKEMNILYFDMTNQYVYVENRDSELLKHCNSKAKRYDLKHFGLAMTASAKSGIPLFHKVYPANVHDSKFFGNYVEELTDKIRETGQEPKGKTLIFDKGNNSDVNIKKVLGLEYDIIGALKPSEHKELISTQISDLTESFRINDDIENKSDKILYRELVMKIYGKKMKVVITFDKNTKRRRKHSFDDYASGLSAKIKDIQNQMNEQLNKPRKSKWGNDENVIEKAESVVSKEYSKLFDFKVRRSGKGITIETCIVSDQYDAFQEKFGKNLLFTNRLDLDAKEVIRLYRRKDSVEKIFEYMKSFKLILLEPQYHSKDNRILVNTFLKVVSMQIVAYLNKILTEKKSHVRIFEAVEELKSIYKVIFRNFETGTVREMPVLINEKQADLVKNLGVDL